MPWRMRAQITAMRLLTGALKRLGLRERVVGWRVERRRARRRAAEARGDDSLSHPALHDMDVKLDAAIDRDGGFYVEAGANDGFTQSNTYWLERFRGWHGVLVEPMPELAALARAERPAAQVIQAALVSDDFDGDSVEMQFGDLMSVVSGSRGREGDDRAWVAPGLALGWRDAYTADVRATTLSAVLDEVGAPEIDLLSLDVEGYELDVLGGLDLARHAPRFVLVEMHDPAAMRGPIEVVLGERYVEAGLLSPLDVLYRRRDVSSS